MDGGIGTGFFKRLAVLRSQAKVLDESAGLRIVGLPAVERFGCGISELV